jgi:hypothetical protein
LPLKEPPPSRQSRDKPEGWNYPDEPTGMIYSLLDFFATEDIQDLSHQIIYPTISLTMPHPIVIQKQRQLSRLFLSPSSMTSNEYFTLTVSVPKSK